MAAETLFPQPPRRRGTCESALGEAMKAWNDRGILDGQDNAAARGVLRDAARAVDAARDDMQAGRGSPFSFARCNELFRLAVASYMPAEAVSDDDLDDWAGDLGPTASGDAPQS